MFIDFPINLARKCRAEKPGLLSPAQRNKSAWTGRGKILLMPGTEQWSFNLVMRPLATEAEVREARAFFFALEGIANTFEMPFLPSPQLNTGSVITATATVAAGGKQIPVSSVASLEKGMPVSVSLPSGHKRLLIITGIAGNTITVQPGLTEQIANGAIIEVDNPVCHVRLSDPFFTYDDSKGLAGFSVAVEEAVGEPGGAERPVNTVQPVITGDPEVGQVFTVDNGTWTNGPTSYEYQWFRNGVTMTGRTSNSYTLGVDDVGSTFTARVTAFNAAGSRWRFANETAVVQMPPLPVNTVAPALTGSKLVGSTLNVDNGTWENDPIEFDYFWYRDGVEIPGAMASSYVLTAADVGADIHVEVEATNITGPTIASSNTIGPITDVALHLGFTDASYEALGIPYATLADIPGYSYTRAGPKGEVGINGAPVVYGPELITNGTFNADVAGWAAGSGGTIAWQTPGYMRVTITSGPFAQAYQSLATVVGRLYRVAFTHIAGTSMSSLFVSGLGFGQYELGNANSSGDGSVLEVFFVATTATTYITLTSQSVTSGQYFDVDNVTLKSIIDGPIINFGTNEPGIVPGVGYWARQQLTNHIIHSRDATNAAWTKRGTGTVTTDTQTRADGTGRASKISGLGALGNDVYNISGGNAAGTSSVFIKKASAGGVVNISNPWAGGDNVDVDLSALGPGWERITPNHPAITATAGLGLYHRGGLLFSAVSGTPEFYIDHTQSLNGNLPDGGPVIATGGATATVNADALEVGGSLPDDDFIIWTALNRRVANVTSYLFNYSTAAGGTSAEQLRLLLSSANKLSMTATAGGVGQQYGPDIVDVGTGRLVCMLRRKNGIYSLAIKLADGTIIIGADASAPGAVPAVTAVDIGSTYISSLQPNSALEWVEQRHGTFDDAAVSAILAAA